MPNYRRYVSVVSTALVIAFSASSSLAEPNRSPDAKSVVKDIFTKASTETVSTDEQLQQEINARIDFAEMARAALGSEFRRRSPQERVWFERTLQEIITRTVYPEAPKFLKQVKISYKKVKQDGKSATVSSVVRNRGERTLVSYDLRQDESGEWRVVDVAFDGESWVENIREQVRRTLRKRNWSGLKERMNRRLATLRSGNSENTKKAKQAKAKPSAISES